jgi:hypothetical protein
MAVSASSQNWKDKNSNYKIKVSESTVAKLRKGTKASNIAAANKPGATAEYKEAVRRFYGKNAVSGAPSKAPGPKQTGPVNPPSKKPGIERGNPKPTPAQIADGKRAKADANKNKLTPNQRESRRTVPSSPKPAPGPGGRKPAPPRGGPGVKPRPSKGQTPNQREGRRTSTSPRPSSGPGGKMPKRPSGGPGAKGRIAPVPVIERGNPKPSKAEMDRAKRARIAGQAGTTGRKTLPNRGGSTGKRTLPNRRIIGAARQRRGLS